MKLYTGKTTRLISRPGQRHGRRVFLLLGVLLGVVIKTAAQLDTSAALLVWSLVVVVVLFWED